MTAIRSLIAFLLLAPASLWAATIALAPGEVAVAANGQCSLIEAIHNANADAQVDNGDCGAGSGADTLLLPVGGFDDYVLQQPDAVNADNGLPVISSAITIDAPTPGVIRRATAACNRNGTADPGEFRLIEVVSGGSLTLRNLSLRSGCADGSGPRNDGGAVRVNSGATLIAHRVDFASNRARDKSGAVDVDSGATVTITASKFQNNQADGGAGAIGNGDSIVTIDSSTFSNNSAGGEGGGAIGNFGTLHLRNSTVSGNDTTGNGGAIGNGSGGTSVIEFSTLVDNSASGALGGGGIGNAGTLQIKNSIVADNGADDCVNLGAFEAFGENFDSSGSCAAIDPDFVQATLAALNLGNLSSNSGFTFSHLPGAGSVVIDAVSDCTAVDGLTAYERDQRDLPRPWDGDGQNGAQCDVGSVEVIPLGSEQIVVDGVSCTLGDAIEAANSSQTVAGCANALFGSDTLILNAPVLLTGADTLRSTEREGAFAALPDITSQISIEPGTHRRIERDPGLDCVSADGPNEFRLFNVVAEGELRLEDVELANGCANRGGAVLVADAALLALQRDDTGVSMIGNTARSTTLSAQGGAIWIDSSAQSEINGARFEGNRAIGARAQGGALWENGALVELLGSRFDGNQALAMGATIAEREAQGGAAHLVRSSIRSGVFSDNLAQGGDAAGSIGGSARGGALYVDNLDESAPQIADTLFEGNSARGGQGNTGGRAEGGAAFLSRSGITIVRATFQYNLAEAGLGMANAEAAIGGALRTTALVELDHVTISHNEARGGSSVPIGGNAEGGGLSLDTGSVPLMLRHSTVAANRAIAGTGGVPGVALGGGLSIRDKGTTQIFSSVLEGNVAVVGAAISPSECFADSDGTFDSLGFNTLAEASPDCAFDEPSDQTGVGPSLIPLGDYGCVETLPDGACLPTHPVRVGRPAQDAASCASGATEDARGSSRPWDDPNVVNADDGCDAGAYESRDVDNDGFDDDSIRIHDDGFE